MSEDRPPTTPEGRPARYQRSAGGLLGAMVVLLLAIAAFVAFRGLTRDQPEVRPEPVDYLQTVRFVQQSGRDVVYPARLPSGWIATAVDVGEAGDETWGISMLTEQDAFAGVRQEDAELDDLLAEAVDENPEEGDGIEVDGSVATRWRQFTDDGGDTAYAAEVGGDWVLVYGSASAEDLRELLGTLTLDPR